MPALCTVCELALSMLSIACQCELSNASAVTAVGSMLCVLANRTGSTVSSCPCGYPAYWRHDLVGPDAIQSEQHWATVTSLPQFCW